MILYIAEGQSEVVIVTHRPTAISLASLSVCWSPFLSTGGAGR